MTENTRPDAGAIDTATILLQRHLDATPPWTVRRAVELLATSVLVVWLIATGVLLLILGWAA